MRSPRNVIQNNLCFLKQNISEPDVQRINDKFVDLSEDVTFPNIMHFFMEKNDDKTFNDLLKFLQTECLKKHVVLSLEKEAADLTEIETNIKRLDVNLLGRILLRVLDGWIPVAKALGVDEEEIQKSYDDYSKNEQLYKINVFDWWRKRKGFGENGVKELLIALKKCQECVVDWGSMRELLNSVKQNRN